MLRKVRSETFSCRDTPSRCKVPEESMATSQLEQAFAALSYHFKADGSAPHVILSNMPLICWHRPLSELPEVWP